MTILIYSLAILIALLQLADYWLTAKVLEHEGTELNPVMSKLMQTFGQSVGLAIGKLSTAVFVLTGAYLGWFTSNIGVTLLIGLFGLYCWVVWHNWMEYKKVS